MIISVTNEKGESRIRIVRWTSWFCGLFMSFFFSRCDTRVIARGRYRTSTDTIYYLLTKLQQRAGPMAITIVAAAGAR